MVIVLLTNLICRSATDAAISWQTFTILVIDLLKKCAGQPQIAVCKFVPVFWHSLPPCTLFSIHHHLEDSSSLCHVTQHCPQCRPCCQIIILLYLPAYAEGYSLSPLPSSHNYLIFTVPIVAVIPPLSLACSHSLLHALSIGGTQLGPLKLLAST